MTRRFEYALDERGFRCGARWVVFEDGEPHGWFIWPRDGRREPCNRSLADAEINKAAGIWREVNF